MARWKALDQPESVVKDGIPIVCTHIAHGFTFQEWEEMPLRSYTLKGIVVSDKFIPVSSPEMISLTWHEYEQLLRDTPRSEVGDFTVDEVKLAHEAVSAALTDQFEAARSQGQPFLRREPIDITTALQ